MVRSTVKKVMRVGRATVLISEGGSVKKSIRLRRELLLVALIVGAVGAVLLAVGGAPLRRPKASNLNNPLLSPR
jgi:hypothetical protein